MESPTTDLAVARLVVPPGGAVAGLAAAWVMGVLVHPFPAVVDVAVPPGDRKRNRPGIRFRVAALSPADIQCRAGLPVTSPLRTAMDIARTLPFTDAVVQLDAMAHARLLTVRELSTYTDSHPGLRGIARARIAIRAIEAGAESPMETRLRLLLLAGGLPSLAVQHVLRDGEGTFVARLDLAYVAERLAIEYDGAHHRDQVTFDKDLARQNLLFRHGWALLRYTATSVFRRQEALVAEVKAVLTARGSSPTPT